MILTAHSRSPETDVHIHSHLIYDKELWKRAEFSISSAESFGFCKEKKKWNLMLISPQKQKWNPGIKGKTKTFLEDNTGEYLHNFGVRTGYLNQMKKTLW